MNLKKILFVGINYHGYTEAIADELRAQFGCNLNYVDIQPRAFLWNLIKIVVPKIFRLFLNLYHKQHFRRAALVQYDYVLFLQAHQVEDSNLEFLRLSQPKAVFILYNWDSLANHDYLLKRMCFDRILTFDPCDAKEHNFEYLPLFCTRELQAYKKNQSKDIFMIGNIVNLRRVDAVREFKRFCVSEGISFHTHLRISALILTRLIRQKYTLENLSMRNASRRRVKSLYEQASVAFDWANHEQSGLTMRAAEALGTGKKLITNCSYLRDSKYSRRGQVLIINESFDFSEVKNFVNKSPLSYAPDEYFYIQSFISTLMNVSK